MSYIRKPISHIGVHSHPRTAGMDGVSGMGDLASTVTAAATAIGIAADLAADPYLPETVCHLGQLRDLNAGRKPAACIKQRDGLPGGVGLRKVIKLQRAYIYAEQHKWAYVAAGAAVIGVPMLLGYMLGKGGR